jgi:hypothetical protein
VGRERGTAKKDLGSLITQSGERRPRSFFSFVPFLLFLDVFRASKTCFSGRHFRFISASGHPNAKRRIPPDINVTRNVLSFCLTFWRAEG